MCVQRVANDVPSQERLSSAKAAAHRQRDVHSIWSAKCTHVTTNGLLSGPLLTRGALVKRLKVSAIKDVDRCEKGITIKARGQANSMGLSLQSAGHFQACVDVAFRNEGVPFDSS